MRGAIVAAYRQRGADAAQQLLFGDNEILGGCDIFIGENILELQIFVGLIEIENLLTEGRDRFCGWRLWNIFLQMDILAPFRPRSGHFRVEMLCRKLFQPGRRCPARTAL